MAQNQTGTLLQKALATELRNNIVATLCRHLREEHEVELGRFEAEELLDLVAGLVGPHYYNEGLRDAQALLARQVDEINERLYEMERQPEG
ncbi:DUF2164 domain-containing protein [Peteryoungia ipomoeae]|uniref:DUF2164 domain-containing protein n=1 Tax=Peteryoungia ipomoeae TaxID=1210932 RepID=UPI001FE5EF88|nr:DUF2164 domain-containing protein [Peteryoungia ipomoeae]